MEIEINPSFVTFEQAKLLKSKDYDILTNNHYYDEKGNLSFCQTYSHTYKEIVAGRGKYITAPEQWQVIEWLFIKHNIWIQLDYDFITFDVKILHPDKEPKHIVSLLSDPNYPILTKPQEAYSKAFDYVLNEMI
jgi:hypothetical protein